MLVSDSTLGSQQRVRFGMDKIANTFLFRGELSGTFPLRLFEALPLGTLIAQSQYRGSAIRTSGFAVRDDADALVRFEQPLDSAFSLVVANASSFSADSRAIGLNRLLQLGLSAGAQWKSPQTAWQPFEQVTVRFLGGGEFNEQLGIADRGWTLAGGVAGRNLRLDDYALSLDAGGFWTNLSNIRTNTQFNTRLTMSRTFEGNAQLDISAQYTALERDFYTTLQQGMNPALAIETRLERLLRVNGRFALPIVSGIEAEVQGFVENWAVGRKYNSALEQVPISAVQRDVDQLRFSLNTTLRAQFATSNHAAGFTVDNRNEANRVTERFSVADVDLQTLRSAELQRDNVSIRWTLWAQTAWMLASGDSLRGEYSTSLLRYDTPSALNNDDRDELTINANASYTHIFSHIFSGTILAEMRLAHLVFIKSQRSAQNNWNRIIRLAPYFTIKTGVLEMRPQFEVLANYTSFDFEDVLGTVQSFSLRQVAYRDSLRIILNPHATLESRILFRYFERGEFRWREFSETPRDQNLETFVRLLCVTQAETTWLNAAIPQRFGRTPQARIGIGGRVYVLTQEPIAAPGGARPPGFVNRAVAPETLVELDFASGTLVRLTGWYEFQFDKTSFLRGVPNILCSVTMSL
jgi:PAS domain-containing protein